MNINVFVFAADSLGDSESLRQQIQDAVAAVTDGDNVNIVLDDVADQAEEPIVDTVPVYLVNNNNLFYEEVQIALSCLGVTDPEEQLQLATAAHTSVDGYAYIGDFVDGPALYETAVTINDGLDYDGSAIDFICVGERELRVRLEEGTPAVERELILLAQRQQDEGGPTRVQIEDELPF